MDGLCSVCGLVDSIPEIANFRYKEPYEGGKY